MVTLYSSDLCKKKEYFLGIVNTDLPTAILPDEYKTLAEVRKKRNEFKKQGIQAKIYGVEIKEIK